MSDIGSDNLRQNIDKIIQNTLKIWEEFGFKDISHSKIFQDYFKGFTEEDLKSASIHHLCKAWDYLQKFGI